MYTLQWPVLLLWKLPLGRYFGKVPHPWWCLKVYFLHCEVLFYTVPWLYHHNLFFQGLLFSFHLWFILCYVNKGSWLYLLLTTCCHCPYHLDSCPPPFPSLALVACSYTGTHSCSEFTSVMATTCPKTLSRVFLSILWLLHCFCSFFWGVPWVCSSPLSLCVVGVWGMHDWQSEDTDAYLGLSTQ